MKYPFQQFLRAWSRAAYRVVMRLLLADKSGNHPQGGNAPVSNAQDSRLPLTSATELAVFKSFDQHFNDEAIIRGLCQQRIKAAENRNQREYVDRLAGYHRNDRPRKHIDELLPSRRAWSEVRPRFRKSHPDVSMASLLHATIALRKREPTAPWVLNLNAFIARMRHRVLESPDFAFTVPEVHWELKKGHEYRALCRFELEDNIINGLLAEYLREQFDSMFEQSALAFRARPPQGDTPTHNDAYNHIHDLKSRNPRRDYYVAECDIRGFYDSVDHNVARQSLQDLAARFRAKFQQTLDVRAERIFQAYLDCYSFPQNVLTEARPRLQQEDQKGDFPWPVDALKAFHPEPCNGRIGVPQGGAISGVIANMVLDLADKRIEQIKQQAGAELHYFRYCDDMILIAPDQQVCRAAFDVYCTTLRELKLPYHPPTKVEEYSNKVWDFKSKAPYCWTGKKGSGCVPWVGFVGYQVRYDGLVRPRNAAVAKHHQKLITTTDEVKFGLIDRSWQQPTMKRPNVRAAKKQVQGSLRARLTCMGVGRVNPFQPHDEPLPKCWAGGFRALHGKPLIKTCLKQFDRQRERAIRRLGRAKLLYGSGLKNGNRRDRRLHKNGYMTSYFAQFPDAGGAELIRKPYGWRVEKYIRWPIKRFKKWKANVWSRIKSGLVYWPEETGLLW